jgi:hypothetical protein
MATRSRIKHEALVAVGRAGCEIAHVPAVQKERYIVLLEGLDLACDMRASSVAATSSVAEQRILPTRASVAGS